MFILIITSLTDVIILTIKMKMRNTVSRPSKDETTMVRDWSELRKSLETVESRIVTQRIHRVFE